MVKWWKEQTHENKDTEDQAAKDHKEKEKKIHRIRHQESLQRQERLDVMRNFTESIKREIDGKDVDIEVEVTYSYYKGYRGYRNSLGVPEEHDEPPSCEIESVTNEKGEEVEITDDELERFEARALEHHDSEVGDYYFNRD